MKFDPQEYNRRSIRLKDYDYTQPGYYYVTIVTQNRKCLFGEINNGEMVLNEAGSMIQDIWKQLPNKYFGVDLDQFQLMPNHLHGVIVLVGTGPRACPDKGQPQGVVPTISLSDIVHRFKSFTTRKYIDGVNRCEWVQFDYKLLQRSFYDHVIRDETELKNVRKYIVNNPLKWELDIENPDY